MKFREEYSRRLGRGSDRILRMLVLPGKKHLVRLIEIKVVEQTKSLIQGGPGSRHIGRKSRSQTRLRSRLTPVETARRIDAWRVFKSLILQTAVLCLSSSRRATYLSLDGAQPVATPPTLSSECILSPGEAGQKQAKDRRIPR